MSKFFNWMVDHVREDVASQLSAVGDGNFRSVFIGMPEHMLDDLLQRLVSDGMMSVSVAGQEKKIIVLLPAKTPSNPPGIRSGRCNQGYLVSVRNSAIKRLLTLQPPDDTQIKSIRSTVSHFGVSPAALKNASAWISDAFVREILLEAVRARGVAHGGVPSWLYLALLRLAELEENDSNANVKWTVIRRLFDQPAPDMANGNYLVTFAAAGLVRPSSIDGSHEDLVQLVELIGEFLENEGLSAGFIALRECAEQLPSDDNDVDAIIAALDSFEQHVYQVAKSAPEFSSASLRYYCPYSEDRFDEDIPGWWNTLDANMWHSLLDCKPAARSCIKINVTNGVARSDLKGLPAVTDNNVAFAISVSPGASRPGIAITRRIGRGAAEIIGTVASGAGDASFTDSNVPSHTAPLTYTFEPSEPSCKAASTKVIVLCAYVPGFVASSRGAEKVTLPKAANAKEQDVLFECDLELCGQGIHQLDLLACSGFEIAGMVQGYGVTTDDDEESETTVTPSKVADGRWNFDAETDEECRYEFDYTLPSGDTARARLNLRAGDVEPAGARSEFHRLVLEVTRGRSARVTIRESQRLYTLQRWMLADKFSYQPLLISASFVEKWCKPDWMSAPLLSASRPVYDPRPGSTELNPPGNLVELRYELATLIRGESGDGICERAALGKLYKRDEFRAIIDRYVELYAEWLKDDYAHAALFDTVFACFYQQDSEMLHPVPVAVMLSPLHPVRLGWQVVAQHLLVDALDRGVRCPGASVIDPVSVPDSIALPVVRAQGDTSFVPFVSIPSNSDYWGILWNVEELDRVGSSEANRLFGDELGISISGLSAGFSAAQVMRGMREVFAVSPGRSRLRVRLLSDVEGKSDTDNGIREWAIDNLGSNDPWQAAARTSMDVYDARGEGQRPTEPFVANLTSRTRGAARWLVDGDPDGQQVDLSIIAHLKRITPESFMTSAYSAASIGSLTRERVRYRLSAADGRMVGESRTLPAVLESTSLSARIDGLASSVESVDWQFESAMAEQCSCAGISFAPNLPTLERGLAASTYCAVSSTDIDSSAFLRPQHGSYLWDYDLPSYAGKAQDNVGYYLLAQHSTEIEKQVERALALLGDMNLDGRAIRGLLSEISRRGLPSLKELASGGTSATGEVGLLAACRLLQGPPGDDSNVPRLLPLIGDEGKVLNLLLPVDPFTEQFNDLRKALGLSDFRRPDLLVASIRLEEDMPIAIKLTPIEVKARTDTLNVAARRLALGQASSFANFLSRLFARAEEEPVWHLAAAKFMVTWFSFGFRVYEEMAPPEFRNSLMKTNAAVNQALLRGRIKCQVDKRGRLVVIDSGSTSHPVDLDDDGFKETIALKPGDVLDIILSPGESGVLQGIVEKMGAWDMIATTVPRDHGVSTEPASDYMPSGFPESVQSGVAVHDENEPSRESAVNDSETVAPVESPVTTEIVDMEHDESSGIRFNVGTTLDSFREETRELFPGNTRLTQLNVGIVGNLGTGKTQLIKTLIYQISRNQENNFGRRPFFLIFDYKRDYSDPEFVDSLNVKVIKPRRIPINIFDTSTVPGEGLAWLERSNFLFDVLAKIYPGIGPVQRENLKRSVKSAFEVAELNGRGAPTLADVFAEYNQIVTRADAVYSILSDMVDMELFEENTENLVPFSTFLDGVVVVDLASLGQNDNTKNMLVVLFLNLFYENMLRLEKFPFVGNDPQLRTINGFLLVDEADNIMRYQFPVLQNVLLQGREFGVGVLLASQYLSHFKPDTRTNYREPLLTWFVHQVPSLTVNELKGIGLSHADSGMTARIQGLDQHECLYKSLDVDGEFIRGVPYYVLRNQGG